MKKKEARAVLEEMQENVDEAHAGGSEAEQRLCREPEVYTYSWDRGSGRPQNISDILWEMMQSNDTKSENLDEDFDEILERARQEGGMKVRKPPFSGPRK